MKTKFMLVLLFIMCYSFTSYSQIKIEYADELISKYLEELKDVSDYSLYSYKDIVSPNKEFVMFKNKVISPEYETFAYFLDEMPLANWSHNCKLLFVNIKTGNIITVADKFPPNGLENWRVIKEKTFPHTGIVPYPLSTVGKEKMKGDMLQSGGQPSKCYAVIISGGMNSSSNYIRYWNDCSYIYSTLINKYGYLRNNIYVLMSDGINPANDRHLLNGGYDSSPLDLNGDGTNDIQYSATPANITTVFNTLASKLTSDDHLFIYTTDHGSLSNSESYLCLWNSDISATAFANEVNKVKAGNISIVMEQCYSGGFIPALSKVNRNIATACKANEVSYAMLNGLYNEFVYYWTAAVAGKLPNGTTVNADANNDSYVSMEEAFNYANLNDVYVNGIYHYGTLCIEHPQYNSNPVTLGQGLYLRGSIPCNSTTLTGTQTTKLVECKEIIMQNATVPNGVTLELKATERIVINSDVTVKTGGTLILNGAVVVNPDFPGYIVEEGAAFVIK